MGTHTFNGCLHHTFSVGIKEPSEKVAGKIVRGRGDGSRGETDVFKIQQERHTYEFTETVATYTGSRQTWLGLKGSEREK